MLYIILQNTNINAILYTIYKIDVWLHVCVCLPCCVGWYMHHPLPGCETTTGASNSYRNLKLVSKSGGHTDGQSTPILNMHGEFKVGLQIQQGFQVNTKGKKKKGNQ